MLNRSGGMTLVELLLSLAIGVLVVTLVFTTYRTVSATLQGQREREEGPRAMARAERQIGLDLMRMFEPGDDRALALALERGGAGNNTGAVLKFCATLAVQGEQDLRWSDAAQIEYRLVRGPDGRAGLARIERVLSGVRGALPPASNIVAHGVGRFAVSLYDGTAWHETWPPAGSPTNPPAPKLARIALGNLSVEVFLPAGLAVTSQFQRAASAP